MLQTLDHGDDVRELRLDRPPVNALSPALIAALSQAVRSAPETGARALVLSGREGMFSAGLDIPLFLELDREGVRRAWLDLFDLMEALVGSPIPIASAVTGHAPAGGCVLALSCDHRVMAAGDYKIGLNEVQVGVTIPLPILAVARHVVGARQAERMCTEAVLMSGGDALRIGLVDQLVPGVEVVPRAVKEMRRLIALPPGALARTRALNRTERVESFAKMRESEALETFLDTWFGDETRGALQAVVERLAAKKKG